MANDFQMFRGNAKTLEVTVEDEDGAVVDITGVSSIRWQLARNPRAAPVLSKSVGSGITVVSAAAGRFNVAISKADTAGLRGRFYHEAEVVLADGTPGTVIWGQVTIKPTLIEPAA